MFFPKRMKSIDPGDRVLEIGPGGTPHRRADTLLERRFSATEAEKQRGYVPEPQRDDRVVYYDGDRFPFTDGEFDYVICSHVIEHVENVEEFLSEMFRVARRGYMEYPTIYYEYLYNFSVHLNFVKFKNDCLFYLRKSDTSFKQFLPVHKFFYRSLEMGHDALVTDLREFMIEGFEWQSEFKIKRAVDVSDLVFDKPFVPENPRKAGKSLGAVLKKMFCER